MRRLEAELLAVALLALLTLMGGQAQPEAQVLTTPDDPEVLRQQCIAQFSVPAELAQRYKRWQYPDDAKTHCYLRCIFEKFSFFGGERGFDVHKIHQHLAQDTSGQLDRNDGLYAKIAACAERKPQYGDDLCKWAYYGVMCFIRDELLIVVDNDKPQPQPQPQPQQRS